MATQIIAKLIEIAYNETQSNQSEPEIEDRLLNNLLGKSLDFTTEQGTQGTIRFQSLGRGKVSPSTVVNLQVEGVDFSQEANRLTLDFRYVFYKAFGHGFMFNGSPSNFLAASPFVQKLGPSNILIEFVLYGDTIYQVNRSLSIFARVVKQHQDSLHQKAIEMYDEKGQSWGPEPEVSLDEPITDVSPIDDPIDFIQSRVSDEAYIQEYIKYVGNTDNETRDTIDNRNTLAKSDLE